MNLSLNETSTTKNIDTNAVVAIEVSSVHKHEYSPPLVIDDMPNGGRPPAPFTLQICRGCKTAIIFPFDNFSMASQEDQRWLIKELENKGIMLVKG